MKHRSIVNAICEEKCILFIGPELIRYKGYPIQQFVYSELYNKFNSEEAGKPEKTIKHFYQEEGYFILETTTARSNFRSEMRKLLKTIWKDEGFHRENEAVFHYLSEIPFHLILTVNSDKFLYDAIEQAGGNPSFGYYIGGDIGLESIGPFSKNVPLVYNLYGVVENSNSLILEYNDLFKFLSAFLSKEKSHIPIVDNVSAANAFLFLGFELEKWNTQLLIQWVQHTANDHYGQKVEKYSNNFDFSKDSSKVFFDRLFKVIRIGESVDFLAELYEDFLENQDDDECQLRILQVDATLPIGQVRNWIAKNKFENAFAELKQHLNNEEDKNAFTLLEARWKNLIKERDITEVSEYALEWRRILYSLLELARSATLQKESNEESK